MIDAVVFDVGETLIDETREYETWADWLGVPRHTFSAVFGAVIALGMDYRDAFQYFRPGFRLDDEGARRADVANLRRSARTTCTQTRGLAWRHCVTWVFGWASPVIRQHEQAKYAEAKLAGRLDCHI